MLHSTLIKLLELADLPRLSSHQTDEATALMRELRRCGFTNRDIEVLVNGRWKEATIKRKTRGEKVRTTEERDIVLETYSKFSAAGKTLQNLEDYLAVNQQLEFLGVTMETMAKYVMSLVSQKINVSNFLKLYEDIEQSVYTVKDVSDGLDILNELEQQGIAKETLEELNKETKKYGGLNNLINAIVIYEGLQDIKRHISEANDIGKRLQEEIIKLEIEIEKTEAESLAFKSYLNVAKSLVLEHSFDLYSLKTLVDVAKKYGDPTQIYEAIAVYKNLEGLEKEILVIRGELIRLNDEKKEKEAELTTLNRFIDRANRAIGKIEANYDKSIIIQTIADIIYKSDGVELDINRFKEISLLFLTGINRYAKNNVNSLHDWDDSVSFFLKYTIEGLTKIL